MLRNPVVSVALSGCRTVAEIEENIEALDVKITDDALAEIDAIMAGAAGQTDVVPGRHHQFPERSWRPNREAQPGRSAGRGNRRLRPCR